MLSVETDEEQRAPASDPQPQANANAAVAGAVCLNWIEWGIERGQRPDGTLAVSEVGLLNASLGLPGDQLRAFNPSDRELGFGYNASPNWEKWPPHFRASLLFRHVGGDYLLFIMRGEPEYPDSPNSRYFSYGLWLFLPEHWFLGERTLEGNQLLATRMLSAIRTGILYRSSEVRGEQRQAPMSLKVQEMDFSAPLPHLQRTAEWAVAARDSVCITQAAEEGREAELLTQMTVAAFNTNDFQKIAKRGIEVYPPSAEKWRCRSVWIVPCPLSLGAVSIVLHKPVMRYEPAPSTATVIDIPAEDVTEHPHGRVKIFNNIVILLITGAASLLLSGVSYVAMKHYAQQVCLDGVNKAVRHVSAKTQTEVSNLLDQNKWCD